MSFLWVALTSLLTLWGAVKGADKHCPSPTANPSCHCYDYENGIFLECPAATVHTLRKLLDAVQVPIHSLSIYEPDKSLVPTKKTWIFLLKTFEFSGKIAKKSLPGITGGTSHTNFPIQHRGIAR